MNIDRFENWAEQEIGAEVRNLGVSLAHKLILANPVDTGWSSTHWRLTKGLQYPEYATSNRPEDRNDARTQAVTLGRVRLTELATADTDSGRSWARGGVVYNDVPYVPDLEYRYGFISWTARTLGL